MLAVLVTAVTGAYLSSLDNRLSNSLVNMMDMQLTFSSELFRSYLSRWSEKTVLLFIQYLQADLLFSLLCALTLSSVLGMMWKHLLSLCGDAQPPKLLTRIFPALFFLPYAAALAGIAEDFLLYSAVRLGQTGAGVILAASSLAAVKYFCLALSVTGVMGLLAARRRRMKGR